MWSAECPGLAVAVEKVSGARIFETMIQNPGRCWINVASSSAYKNDSCTKSVGSDFFNSLSQKRKSSVGLGMSAYMSRLMSRRFN
jgi:hypothetical protein